MSHMRRIMRIIAKRLLKNVKFLLLIFGFFCVLEAGYSKSIYLYDAPPEAQHYPILNYTLIELISVLPKYIPTTLEKAQLLFNNQLHLESDNGYNMSYFGGPFITRDGIVITNADITVRKNSKKAVRNINFSINQKQCVSTDLLKKKFGFHILTFLSPHPVDHPRISYIIHLGKISFAVGTTLDNEGCATGISIITRI